MNTRVEPPQNGTCPVSKKVRWAGKRAAKVARTRMIEAQRIPGTVYRCQHCGDWHLTRQFRKAA